jgi:hypothetical protein
MMRMTSFTATVNGDAAEAARQATVQCDAWLIETGAEVVMLELRLGNNYAVLLVVYRQLA